MKTVISVALISIIMFAGMLSLIIGSTIGFLVSGILFLLVAWFGSFE